MSFVSVDHSGNILTMKWSLTSCTQGFFELFVQLIFPLLFVLFLLLFLLSYFLTSKFTSCQTPKKDLLFLFGILQRTKFICQPQCLNNSLYYHRENVTKKKKEKT